MLCRTCGAREAWEHSECTVCRGRWDRAKRNPKHLPTVELFPLDEVVKPIPPKVGKTLDMFQ